MPARPRLMAQYTSLGAFWQIFNMGVNLSPVSDAGFPSVTMITEIEAFVPMPAQEFWACVEIAYGALVAETADKIKARLRRK